MQARLSMEIVNGGQNSKFVRVSKGRFYLRRLLDTSSDHDQPLAPSNGKTELTQYTTQKRTPPSRREMVLCFNTSDIEDLLDFQGIKPTGHRQLCALLARLKTFYRPRLEAEELEGIKHFVTYVMVTCNGEMLGFRRGSYNNVAAFLRGSRCIGFGGHVAQEDHDLFSSADLGITQNAIRELSEEVATAGPVTLLEDNLNVIGLINDNSSKVGKRHLAVVFHYEVPKEHAAEWKDARKGEVSINQLNWIDTQSSSINLNEFEYWSQLCLREFYPQLAQAQPTYKIVKKGKFKGPHLLAIVGSIGSGKTFATRVLVEKYGYRQINSGQVLANLLDVSPVPVTPRPVFQNLAEKFIQMDDGPRKLAESISATAEKLGEDRIIVDGIRQRETLEQLVRKSPIPVAVMYIHTTADIAYELYTQRESQEDLSISEFLDLYTAPVESDVRYFIDGADAILFNWTGTDEYGEVLDTFCKEMNIGQ